MGYHGGGLEKEKSKPLIIDKKKRTMKKNYQTPATQEVELLTNASLMNIVEGSTTGAGTDEGSAGDEDPEVAGKSRGEWGNLW